MTLEEQKKYRLQSDFIKRIRQPALNTLSNVGSGLSKVKTLLDETENQNQGLLTNRVQTPDYYRNNANTAKPKLFGLGSGEIVIGGADRFFDALSKDRTPSGFDMLDTAALMLGVQGKL